MVSESGGNDYCEHRYDLIVFHFSFREVLLSERTCKFVQRVGRKCESLYEGGSRIIIHLYLSELVEYLRKLSFN